MDSTKFQALKKGSIIKINGKAYTVIEVIIPADNIEDRARHVLYTVQRKKEPALIRDFRLRDEEGKDYILKVVDKPVYFWDASIGFREEGLIEIKKVEV
jgi:hypothetical protein